MYFAILLTIFGPSYYGSPYNSAVLEARLDDAMPCHRILRARCSCPYFQVSASQFHEFSYFSCLCFMYSCLCSLICNQVQGTCFLFFRLFLPFCFCSVFIRSLSCLCFTFSRIVFMFHLLLLFLFLFSVFCFCADRRWRGSAALPSRL